MFSIFGTIQNPLGNQFSGAAPYASIKTGLPLLITNGVRLTTVISGLWMFANLLAAGIGYIGSNGEPEKINKLWAMIWQSLLGLGIIVSAFAVTGVISQLLFGDSGAMLNPVIYGPGAP